MPSPYMLGATAAFGMNPEDALVPVKQEEEEPKQQPPLPAPTPELPTPPKNDTPLPSPPPPLGNVGKAPPPPNVPRRVYVPNVGEITITSSQGPGQHMGQITGPPMRRYNVLPVFERRLRWFMGNPSWTELRRMNPWQRAALAQQAYQAAMAATQYAPDVGGLGAVLTPRSMTIWNPQWGMPLYGLETSVDLAKMREAAAREALAQQLATELEKARIAAAVLPAQSAMVAAATPSPRETPTLPPMPARQIEDTMKPPFQSMDVQALARARMREEAIRQELQRLLANTQDEALRKQLQNILTLLPQASGSATSQ